MRAHCAGQRRVRCGSPHGTDPARGGCARVPRPYRLRCRLALGIALFKDGQLVGVFDLDSPTPARFDADDQAGLERLAQVYLDGLA